MISKAHNTVKRGYWRRGLDSRRVYSGTFANPNGSCPLPAISWPWSLGLPEWPSQKRGVRRLWVSQLWIPQWLALCSWEMWGRWWGEGELGVGWVHLQRLEWHISDSQGRGQDTRYCLLLHWSISIILLERPRKVQTLLKSTTHIHRFQEKLLPIH